MKAKRHRKVIGIALGERSLLAAEVVAGDRPQVRHVAEMVYPEGASISAPTELGKALADFLRTKGFSGNTAVLGIPAKWLVVKAKEVPPADDDTLANILRIGVEAEFPADLKDLIFDFSSESGGRGTSRNVLLVGTPRKNIEASVAMCAAAGIKVAAITPSALALGGASGSADAKNLVVLSVGASGAELSVQQGLGSSVIRHLRPPTPEAMFVSELRRTVSTLPSNPAGRQMILWDGTGLNAASLGEQLGMRISAAELDSLGVDSSLTGTNGDGSRFAAAVALALVGIEGSQSVDFLHSRLAPLKRRQVSQEVLLAILIGIVLFAGGMVAYHHLQTLQDALAIDQKILAGEQDEINNANDFVKAASYAQYWHQTGPLYLACLRDLTKVMPPDSLTFATSLDFKAENPQASTADKIKSDAPKTVTVSLKGNTKDSTRVDAFVAEMYRYPDIFKNIHRPSEKSIGRVGEREWSFEITFTYVLPKPGAARKILTTTRSEPTTRGAAQ